MEQKPFTVPLQELQFLRTQYPRAEFKNNSEVGKLAVEVVKLYFRSLDPHASFDKIGKGSALKIEYAGNFEIFEIKGTTSKDFAEGQLKISSIKSYDGLVAGRRIIRVTNVWQQNVTLFFMKITEDFTLLQEPRWSIQIKPC